MHADKYRTGTIDTAVTNLFKNIDERFKVTCISVSIWGFVAHGMAFFNKYSMHDDAEYLFGVGRTYDLGRWFLAQLADWFSLLSASDHYSTPLIHGIISITFIAISLCFIVVLLDIQQRALIVMLSGSLTAFPMMAGLFGYMFTAPYYMFALLMTVIGVFLISHWNRWYTFILGTILIALSIGVYQAFIPVAVSIMLFCFIKEINDQEQFDEKYAWKQFLLKTIWFLVACAVFIGIYFIMNTIALYLNRVSLSDYQGINSMGTSGISTYFSRIKVAYQQFFNPSGLEGGKIDSMFPMHAKVFYCILVVVSVILSGLKLWQSRESIAKLIQNALLMSLVPITTNLIFVMTSPESVHSLMVYGQAMFYIYIVWLTDNLHILNKNIENAFCLTVLASILAINTIYCRYDNICYLKAEYQQERAISYFTSMIANIKGTEGFKDEYPVAFINAEDIQDQTLQDIPQFSSIKMLPLWGTKSLTNDYAWLTFVFEWCGYSPKLADSTQLANLPEVKNMPSYPDSGSIKIVNDTVVVKF